MSLRLFVQSFVFSILVFGPTLVRAEVDNERRGKEREANEREAKVTASQVAAWIDEGNRLFEAQKYGQALSKFEQARAQSGSVELDIQVALCLEALGRWTEAQLVLEAALARDTTDEGPTATEPAATEPAVTEPALHDATDNEHSEADSAENEPPFSPAKERAQKELEQLEAEFPRLTLTVPLLTNADEAPRVQLDERSLSWPVVDLPVNPGQHVLSAQWREQSFTQELTFARRDRLEQSLPFVKIPSSEDEQHGNESRHSKPLSVGTWASLGVAFAALATGVTTKIAASSQRRKVEAYCDASACPGGKPPQSSAERENYTRARTLDTVSTVAFVTTGVAAALGVTLLVVDLRRSPNKRSSERGLTLRTSGARFELSGRF